MSSILFPQVMVFKYDEELPIVVALMLTYALVCAMICVGFQLSNGQQSIWVTKW